MGLHVGDSSGGSMHTDRRNSNRKKIDLFVNKFMNGYPYLCRAKNISRTGMKLVRMQEPTPGKAPRYMGLQFQLPGSQQVITASGELVFDDHRAGELGVRFTGLPDASAADIDRFLAS